MRQKTKIYFFSAIAVASLSASCAFKVEFPRRLILRGSPTSHMLITKGPTNNTVKVSPFTWCLSAEPKPGENEPSGLFSEVVDGLKQVLQTFQKNNKTGDIAGKSTKAFCHGCNNEKIVPCPNCDGHGSYFSYGQVTACNSCRTQGFVVCRACFQGDPYDIEAIRADVDRRVKARKMENYKYLGE